MVHGLGLKVLEGTKGTAERLFRNEDRGSGCNAISANRSSARATFIVLEISRSTCSAEGSYIGRRCRHPLFAGPNRSRGQEGDQGFDVFISSYRAASIERQGLCIDALGTHRINVDRIVDRLNFMEYALKASIFKSTERSLACPRR